MQTYYPDNHRKIVEFLTGGRFVTQRDEEFQILAENRDYYFEFFQKSFNYQLVLTTEYGYLISNESNEILSRDASVFIAILCYELDKDGKNFLDLIQHSEFEFDEIDNYFVNSSFSDLILSNKQLKDRESRKNFINTLNRRNIIEKTTEDRFVFTSAYKVFIDFAKDLAKIRMNEEY